MLPHILHYTYRKCPDVLDEGDKSKWEEIILSFLKASQIKVALLWRVYCWQQQSVTLCYLQVILPYIPYQDPKLSAALYEVVLNVLMGEDCKVFKVTYCVVLLASFPGRISSFCIP
jgi:hypothetical protein